MSQSDVAVSGLHFGYQDRMVLKGLSLQAPRGSVTTVVGPNGSGKSTLLKVMSAYLRPSAGSVLLCGQDPHVLSPADRSRLVTYCGDEPEPAFDFSVEETVRLGRVASGRTSREGDSAAAARAMAEVGVSGLKNRPITELSSGERQRVYIARAVCQDPEVLLLDEPTAHLDMSYELQVMDMVVRMAREAGKTVVTVHHDLNLALRYASRLFFLKDGVVMHSLEPAEVTAGVVSEVYGVRALVTTHPSLGWPVIIPESPLG
jgi:iron complex transport system ATP-binding protein